MGVVSFPETSSDASVYTVACDPNGSVLATGSPEKVIHVWDPRSGKRITRLTGHMDLVRSLLVSHDGKYLLSASTDTTVKLWSMAEHRCVATYTQHQDSIWHLFSSSPTLDTFYAAGKDGHVTKLWRDQQANADKWVSVCKQEHGVCRVVARDGWMWTSTFKNSNILQWQDVMELPAAEHVHWIPNALHTRKSHTFINGPSLSPVQEEFFPLDDEAEIVHSLQPIRALPVYEMVGQHGLIKHRMLSNKRFVLTQDTQGVVALWDIIRCRKVKDYGACNMDELFKSIDEPQFVADWCNVDTKIGVILCHVFKCGRHSQCACIHRGVLTQRCTRTSWT
jgi:WD repeat-containing protein 48